jgi:hypothetical protein
MAEAQLSGLPRDEGPESLPEVRLTRDDRDAFLIELARVFNNQRTAEHILRAIGYPTEAMPAFTEQIEIVWGEIFSAFDHGIMNAPYRRLLAAGLRRYGSNSVFTDLDRRYVHRRADEPLETEQQRPAAQAEAPAPAEPVAPTCHVIIRADSENERVATQRWLAVQGLHPEELWSTTTAVSYRLSETDPSRLRRQLEHTDLGWTVVPPGQPDYLISRIYIQGPDGRQFRITDAPAQQTVGDVAAEVVAEYGDNLPHADRPTVVDQVGADGQGRRMNPDNSLHEEGVGEGDQLRVGFQATAAALNPLDRQDALFRVRNQILAYADAHAEFEVRANSMQLPTEYEIEFESPSFGPPPSLDADPPEIHRHVLSIQLDSEFPMTAPKVFWLTAVFHPNVFPNYDCEQARRNVLQQGLVCLGALAESYQPSLDFGELCEMLRDIAGFRNYSLTAPSGWLDSTGRQALRGDYYDRLAAEWAASEEGQKRIRDVGGMTAVRAPLRRPHYRNLIEPVGQ